MTYECTLTVENSTIISLLPQNDVLCSTDVEIVIGQHEPTTNIYQYIKNRKYVKYL